MYRKSLSVALLGILLSIVLTGQAVAANPAYLAYHIKPGDTLWLLGQRYGTTAAEIKSLNKINENVTVKQFIHLPVKRQGDAILYKVQPGDSLFLIASRLGRDAAIIKKANGLSGSLKAGQTIKIPVAHTGRKLYQVVPGDTFSLLAKRFNTTVAKLQQINGMVSGNPLLAGQLIQVPQASASPASASTAASTASRAERPSSASRSSTPANLVLHRVASGETLGAIAKRYSSTAAAIRETNKLHSDVLMPGQPLYVPRGSSQAVYVAGPRGEQKTGYGELLEWDWASWVFNPGCQATVIDFQTRKSFKVRRLGGSTHADTEPLTAADTAVMKSLFGGKWSWSSRPVLLNVNGRLLAASISGMPHDVDTILDNNFPGHFCLYFLNSKGHSTNAIDPQHNANVKRAAGY